MIDEGEIVEGEKTSTRVKIFETWARQFETAYDLEKTPSMPNENPYARSETWKAFEAFCIGCDIGMVLLKKQ